MAQLAATPVRRAFRDDEAWRALHDLAVDAYRETGRWRTWTPDRFDGFLRGRVHDELAGTGSDWREGIQLWEAGGELVAAVHPEGPDEAYLEVRPGWECLRAEVLAAAEGRHRQRYGNSHEAPAMQTYATHDDAALHALLIERGYADRGPMEVLHGRPLAGNPPPVTVPDGYRIRQPDLADPHDLDQFIGITRLVFGATIDPLAVALEARMLTHREYFVAETPDREFASWCGVWAVPEIGVGQFEPVGTHPDHRRRGLASAVMSAGLAWMRQRDLGAAFVGTGVRNASNALYASLGFAVAELYSQWEWKPGLDRNS